MGSLEDITGIDVSTLGDSHPHPESTLPMERARAVLSTGTYQRLYGLRLCCHVTHTNGSSG